MQWLLFECCLYCSGTVIHPSRIVLRLRQQEVGQLAIPPRFICYQPYNLYENGDFKLDIPEWFKLSVKWLWSGQRANGPTKSWL